MLARTRTEQRSHIELITVYEISRILSASLDIDRNFRVALNVLSTHMDLPRAMIVLPDREASQLVVHSWVGLTPEQAARGRWKSGEGVVGHVYSTAMPAAVTNVAEAPEFIDRTGGFGPQQGQLLAMVAVPLKTDRHVLGVLAAQRDVRDGARLSDDQRLMTMVASLLAQAAQLQAAVRDEHQRLQLEASRLQKALQRVPRGRYALDNVIGESKPMQQVFTEVHQAAPSRATVLLRGESGTGKEAIARAIHYLSPRKDGAFIKVNCAALTESLLESELFGHEKGAFTGAVGERKGRFELAHGGTLFLDEIGDISPGFQAKMLRVLQEREFERVGGSKAVKVDVRLICATNRDLEKMVQRGEYRADLYYRINVVSIFLPPLRERRADIPPLVAHFVDRFNKDNARQLKVTPEAMKVLSSCYWPGNVRELENCIERTATMVRDDTIRDVAFGCKQDRCLTQALHSLDKEDAVAAAVPVTISPPISRLRSPAPNQPARPLPPAQPARAAASAGWPEDEGDAAYAALADEDEGGTDGVTTIGPTQGLAAFDLPAVPGVPPGSERERLIWAMERCGWVQAKAARLLRLTPRQMGYALQKNRIEVRKF
ncbi:Nif-specific regulatory protein [Rubrivivax sp. A210]|uniref:nif-specific transcriptional activator NifA n=1 Tax=Rubrivivax sp. A210 TaxID=2772301 RepID=UPI00191A0E9B|nr:nif-specific transcriptional activator NifA [Rubrivivax sp. A210]CAD5371981.1 Nif-specific regulatory protein [Rubrivivax sp. A210]